MKWTVSGKVRRVIRTESSQKPNLEFEYDASGQRIVKKVIKKNGKITSTYYLRDASGNVMSVYEYTQNDDAPVLAEQYLYGSSRIGVYTPVATAVALHMGSISFGRKSYELSDHLGNVRATLSDYRRLGSIAKVKTASDYYPFGMQMTDRMVSNIDGYRYGFNGQEQEVDAGSFNYDFGARMYDSRIAKFLSVDFAYRKYAFWSPYQFAANNPIQLIDHKGNDPILAQRSSNSGNVMIILADSKNFEIDLQDLTLSNWDYVIVTDFKDATAWLEKNYGGTKSEKIKNLVVGTHGNGRGSIFFHKTDMNTDRMHIEAEDFLPTPPASTDNDPNEPTPDPRTKERAGAEMIKGIKNYISSDAKIMLLACGVAQDPDMMQALFDALGGGDIEVFGNQDLTAAGNAGVISQTTGTKTIDMQIGRDLTTKGGKGWMKQTKDGLIPIEKTTKVKMSRFNGITDKKKTPKTKTNGS